MKKKEKELIYKWVAEIVGSHAKDIHRLRQEKGLLKELEPKQDMIDQYEIEQLRQSHFYRGYWKALLWTMDTAYRSV